MNVALLSIPIASYCSIKRLAFICFSFAKQDHKLNQIGIKQGMRYEVIERFSENDLLIEMPVSPQARANNPNLPDVWQVRMICYQHPKGDIKGFITSLTDPEASPMETLLSIYTNCIK